MKRLSGVAAQSGPLERRCISDHTAPPILFQSSRSSGIRFSNCLPYSFRGVSGAGMHQKIDAGNDYRAIRRAVSSVSNSSAN